ncbi:hypothetical protein BS78_01G230100 [Paspalum vaginatum]|nr:hypothetical protein BS78_01G230100 [Paspalum vaginatum]
MLPRLGLLLAVACCTAAATGVAPTGGGNGTTAMCDTVRCGMGRCSDRDLPWLVPYECICDPGWSQPKMADLPILIAPCFIPDCPFDSSCFNLSLAWPKGVPITDPCVAINCGDGGDCRKGQGLFNFTYSCDCHPGYVNFLNLTEFPCIKPCAFGSECSKLGIAGPPPAPAPSTAPGNHHSAPNK